MSIRPVRCALALVSLNGCALDPAGSGGEPLGEAEEALSTSTVASYAQSGGRARSATNGKKMVHAGGALHAVYAVGSTIRYTSSTDGVTWTPPVDLDSTACRHPTIAVASDGPVGVAYVRSFSGTTGPIYYRSRSPRGVWSAPIRVVADGYGVGITPSIAVDGTTMYLTWASSWIYHATFPASLGASLPTAELVTSGTGCATTVAALPSIAVSSGAVRIATLEVDTPDPGCPGVVESYVRLSQRSGSSWTYPADLSSSTTAIIPSSLSMDAAPTGGVYYIGASQGSAGSARTTLYRVSGSPSAPTVATYSLAAEATHVSVAARTQDCLSKVRALWSPVASFGATTYRTATWSGAAPSWLEGAPVSVSGAGRAGTALIASKPLPGAARARYFHGYFEEGLGGASHAVKDAYDTAMAPPRCD
jgi:hypothetical protein